MNTETITPELLGRSVIAVPPLARHVDYRLNHVANGQIIRYLEAGGITTLLYGGNAVFYHISLAEYAEVLRCLVDNASANTTMIPSVGPAYGTMMDQVAILREFAFPTVMVLPQAEIATSAGRAQGTRIFAERYGKPIVLYLKHDNAMSIADVQRVVDEGIVCAIKYAVVRPDPAQDDYLKHLVDGVNPNIIVSGIGEQPAIVHLRQFHLNGFTSGCICVRPELSQEMLLAIKAKNWERAEGIRKIFEPLENLRNSINPIRVLHSAVRLAGIADTGPVLPMLSPPTEMEEEIIAVAAKALRGKH
jgi:dihydrodipicolinate synthase/N-acetylneuraminate lyase